MGLPAETNACDVLYHSPTHCCRRVYRPPAPCLPPPPPGLGVQTNPYAVCEIDMGPFNRNFPRLNMANYIGQGVTFLNRHLSSSMFQVGPVNRGGGGGEEGGRDAAGCDLAPSWTCCYSSPLDWFTLFGEGLEGE